MKQQDELRREAPQGELPRRAYTKPELGEFFESVLVVQATAGGAACARPKMPPAP